jgi:hypothetical protein
MAEKLTEEIIALLRDPATVKVLATTGKDGVPHAVFKGSIHADEAGNLVSLELIESSKSNSNLVHSLWFGRKVSVSIRTQDGTSYEIIGKPERCIISGPVFEKYYRDVRAKLGDVDLGAVWLISPIEIRNETFKIRNQEEAEAHPLFLHLDRIAK